MLQQKFDSFGMRWVFNSANLNHQPLDYDDDDDDDGDGDCDGGSR